MKLLYCFFLLFIYSCGQQTKEATIKQTEKVDEDTITVSEVREVATESNVQYAAELKEYWGEQDSIYPSKIDSVHVTVSLSNKIILKKIITKYDFNSIFDDSYIDDGEIYRAEILKLDTCRNKILILMMFGPPNTDFNIYEVVDVIDFNNKDHLIPVPYQCRPRLRLKDTLISTCMGVYSYKQELFRLKNCHTVFSCLINDHIFFYVCDDPFNKPDTTQHNAHFINFITNDTIKSFYYDQYTEGIDYSALMWYSDEFDKLTYINLKDSTLTVVNSDISESTYQLSELPTNDSLALDLSKRIYQYSILTMDESIFIKFDSIGRPLEINI